MVWHGILIILTVSSDRGSWVLKTPRNTSVQFWIYHLDNMEVWCYWKFLMEKTYRRWWWWKICQNFKEADEFSNRIINKNETTLILTLFNIYTDETRILFSWFWEILNLKYSDFLKGNVLLGFLSVGQHTQFDGKHLDPSSTLITQFCNL